MQQQIPHLKAYNRLVFAAIAECEPFQDVDAITLKGEFAKKVEAAAVARVVDQRKALTASNIATELAYVFKHNNIVVQEAVHHTESGLSVVINSEAVDDEAISRAVMLVQQALDQLDGRYGTVKFGEPISFTPSEIGWLVQH